MTEFLPVSSSGHLALLERSFGVEGPRTAFDVALHAGTLLSVLVFFRADIVSLMRSRRIPSGAEVRGGGSKLLLLLVLGSLPAGVVGVGLGDELESLGTSSAFVGVMLILNGLLLLSSRFVARRPDDGDESRPVDAWRALAIGVAQSMAILRGISRSGATIVVGLHLGLGRREAVRFSFLLFIPVVLGAIALETPLLFDGSPGESSLVEALVGAAVAFAVGLASLKVLVKFVDTARLYLFGPYCILLGMVALLVS